MKRRQFGTWLFAGGLGLAGSLFGSPSDARPGGGQTFRKGSSSSSSDSSRDSSSSDSSRDSSSNSSRNSPSNSFSNSRDDKPMFPERKSEPLFPSPQKSNFSSSPSYTTSTSSGFWRPSTFSTPSTPASSTPSGPVTPYVAPSHDWTSHHDAFALAKMGGIGGAITGFVIHFVKNVREGMREANKGWSSPPAPPRHIPDSERPPPSQSQSQSCASMEDAVNFFNPPDPNFSRILFDDFLYSLYAETQAARGKGTLITLEPYLGKEASRYGQEYPVREVRDVVIGSMNVVSVKAFHYGRSRIQVDVAFQVNYTEVDMNGEAQSYWVEETWTLERLPGALSRPPEKTRMLGCPSCGAPLDSNISATCGYCRVFASPGTFDWTVCHTEIHTREPRGPMLLGPTQEVGTDLPTVMAPNVKEAYGALAQKDPSLGWTAFTARLDTIFQTFHEGWTARDLTIVRPYLTDNLLAMQQYWIETYRRQGLRNMSENPRIVAVHLARVRSDKFFDAMTVRIYAMCLDYTVDDTGAVVAGDRTGLRQYSEYWTLIRGAEQRGQPRTDPVCPNCGAPNSEINMAGRCKSCNAHITSGEFDWVLSRIEQDEAYGDSIG